jgi:hypothetical protein
MLRQAKVSWGGPGTPFVAEMSPLLAGQLALLMEIPEIAAAVKAHPAAYSGIIDLHGGICEALGDYGRGYWSDPNAELFPMKELPSKPRPYAIGRAKVQS